MSSRKGGANAGQGLIRAARGRGLSALGEPQSKALLAAYGVSVPRGRVIEHGRSDWAIDEGVPRGYALKVISPELLHKSDAGGVRLGLGTRAEVEAAMTATAGLPALEGWLLEEMVEPGVEMLVGGVRHPRFGPMIMLGVGGVLVNILVILHSEFARLMRRRRSR